MMDECDWRIRLWSSWLLKEHIIFGTHGRPYHYSPPPPLPPQFWLYISPTSNPSYFLHLLSFSVVLVHRCCRRRRQRCWGARERLRKLKNRVISATQFMWTVKIIWSTWSRWFGSEEDPVPSFKCKLYKYIISKQGYMHPFQSKI